MKKPLLSTLAPVLVKPLALLAFAVMSGCASIFPRTPVEPPEAPLDAHLAQMRSDPLPEDSIGRLPRDLSVPEAAGFRAHARAAVFGGDAERIVLTYLGPADDRVCFGYTDFLDADDRMTAHQFVDEAKTGEATWIEFTDSLDALTGQRAWPAAPGATVLDSVELVDDRVETFEEKRDVGDGAYISVNKDKRVIELKLCGAKPKQATTSHYLVAVSHRLKPAALSMKWDEQLAALQGGSYQTRYALKNNALLVWELTD